MKRLIISLVLFLVGVVVLVSCSSTPKLPNYKITKVTDTIYYVDVRYDGFVDLTSALKQLSQNGTIQSIAIGHYNQYAYVIVSPLPKEVK